MQSYFSVAVISAEKHKEDKKPDVGLPSSPISWQSQCYGCAAGLDQMSFSLEELWTVKFFEKTKHGLSK